MSHNSNTLCPKSAASTKPGAWNAYLPAMKFAPRIRESRSVFDRIAGYHTKIEMAIDNPEIWIELTNFATISRPSANPSEANAIVNSVFTEDRRTSTWESTVSTTRAAVRTFRGC